MLTCVYSHGELDAVFKRICTDRDNMATTTLTPEEQNIIAAALIEVMSPSADEDLPSWYAEDAQ